ESVLVGGRYGLPGVGAGSPCLGGGSFGARGFTRENRLHDAGVGKCYSRFQAAAPVTRRNNRYLRETFIAALRKRTIRSLVCEASGERGRLARCVTRLA